MRTEGERRWTLEGARTVLADVRERTARAVEEAEALVQARRRSPRARRAEIDRRIQAIVSRWARQMEALGVEVKGAWRVGFDNGSGFYCWRWPEAELDWFRDYEDGFEDRQRIQ